MSEAKYFVDRYGKRNRDFVDGLCAGIEAYATWSDGEQVVGVMRTPLRDVLAAIRSEMLEEVSS